MVVQKKYIMVAKMPLEKIRILIHTIADLLFPDECTSCGRRGEILCTECLYQLPHALLAYGDIFSLYEYAHPVISKTIRALKYKNNWRLASILGKHLHEEFMPFLADRFPLETESNERFIVIPVPTSNIRVHLRGYNQSELLARAFVACAPEKYELQTTTLYKIKHTESQVSLKNKQKRLGNIAGSFGVRNQDSILGRVVLIIDDVTTTSATLGEALKMARNAGARDALGITVAH